MLVISEEAQKFVDHLINQFSENATIWYGIALKGSDAIIGTLGYNNFIKQYRSNISYDLLPQY
jgi:RimJ/RimL family protein N-acetyltransferase